ncbi:MAG: AbrB/MazE/SpoVT family DNA-binding domain-containing protein [Candidatus Micrarchaeota archaeon]
MTVAEAQITKMSSRGQIVIPEGVREEMEIGAGSTFVVFAHKDADSILLKKLEFREPVKAFEEMVKWSKQHAAEKGLDTSVKKIVETQHKNRR